MNTDEYEYEDIGKTHISKKGTLTPVKIRYFPDKQISTIVLTLEDPETKELIDETVKLGMNKEDIERYFPSDKFHPRESFDKKWLVSSIIYEAYMKEGLTGMLEEGNRRHFWYSHLKPILLGTMGCINNSTLVSTITQAWNTLVETDLVTYEEMNIYSAKETGRLSVVDDSPFYNLIIGIEKQSYFRGMTRLPQLFNCTLITAGGQPSTGVLRRFFSELKEIGVDLDQDFHVCIASDFDPSGIDIEETFIHKIIGAIRFNGGSGDVMVHRVFVRKEQITDTLLKSQGVPYSIKKVTPKSIKQAETIWKDFVDKTGGLYIPKPDGWVVSSSGVEITKPDVDGDGKEDMLRAILEMDAFSNTIIESVIGRELLKIIRDNDLDETKIMIPEIMRVFEEKKEDVAEEIYKVQDKELIQELRTQFLKDTEEWRKFIDEKEEMDREEIRDRYGDLIGEKEEEKEEREPELFVDKERLENDIESLEEERDDKIKEIEREYDEQLEEPNKELVTVNNEIDEKCKDIDKEILGLKTGREEELETVSEEYNFRIKQYNNFKEDHLAIFNPIEVALHDDIKNKIDRFNYRYRILECRSEMQEKLCDYYNNRSLLTEKNISVFRHPSPAFNGKSDLLEQALNNKDLNIGKVRDSFSLQLLEGMKDVVRNDMVGITFELSKMIELPDLSQEVKDAMEETETELEEKRS